MSLADAFAAIEGKSLSGQTPKRLSVSPPKRRSSEASKLPLQGTGKSKHPDFEKVTVYVRKKTRKTAWRKWEDAEGGDFSDLVEKLLAEYVDA